MELVIDANVMMSALIASEGKTYDCILNERVKLYAPEFLLEEIKEHKDEILDISGLSDFDFTLFLAIISSRIEFAPKSDFYDFISEAEKLSPDPDDTEYFALALKLKCPIWSNDRKFLKQSKVRVYSTNEIKVLL